MRPALRESLISAENKIDLLAVAREFIHERIDFGKLAESVLCIAQRMARQIAPLEFLADVNLSELNSFCC